MILSCVQLNVRVDEPERNYARAAALVRRAARAKADVVLLPETLNTGFAPGQIDPAMADTDGARTKAVFSPLAKELGVNIVAGSVTNRKADGLYNTALVFGRDGSVVAEYDKTHLFSPAGENEAYTAGDALCRFTLDGVRCGLMICYDLRFPELARSLAMPGLDVLLIPAEWPKSRVSQMQALAKARAIENQLFVALCNGCGSAFGSISGGHSTIYGPLGETLAQAGGRETIISADVDIGGLAQIREATPVWRDRRPELYGALTDERERN